MVVQSISVQSILFPLFLPPQGKTNHNPPLLQCGITFMGCDTPSNGSLQWSPLRWVSLRVMDFLRPWVQQRILHRLQPGLFSTVDPHELQGFGLPSHHGLKENGCFCMPTSSFLTDLGVGMVVFLPSHSLTKRKSCPAGFSFLNMFITEALIGFTLPRGGSELELRELLKPSYRGHKGSPLRHWTQTQNNTESC